LILVDLHEGDKSQQPFNQPLKNAALWQQKKPGGRR